MLHSPGAKTSWFGAIGRKILSIFLVWALLLPLLPPQVFAQSVVAPKVQVTDLVVLLVDKDLVSQASLKSRINRYAEDVQRALEHQAVVIPVDTDSSILRIHELLAQYYFSGRYNDGLSRLKGVVLIGDLPIPVVEKNGNYWPSVFPYVDFENTSYTWDYEKEQFVYEDNYLMAPEIWHSIIRSNNEELEDRVEELEDFFDNNHQVHQEQTDFSKKVFYANFERQRKVIPAESFFRYQEWIKYAEPIQYLRFTKHFANELIENQKSAGIGSGVFDNLTDEEKEELADEIADSEEDVSREDVLESLNADTLSMMPDVQSKLLIDNFAQRYFEIYTHWLTEVHERVGKAARWKAGEVDTTPSLVSRKDEASVLILRYFNDLVEEELVKTFNENNIATHLYINHEVPVIYTVGDGEGGSHEEWAYKPFYWNGVYPKNDFEVENCTLIRGSKRDIQNQPLAQQVEANNTLDIRTAETCKHTQEPGYASDPYGGCCAKNLKYENEEFTYNGCIATSTWMGGQNGESSLYHSGARNPVLGLAGTREIDGKQGAAGCLAALHFNEAEEHSTKFSTLMIHDEPKPETVMEQVEAQFSRALPVDDPRGFSFLDHGRQFRRLAFPNVFEFREQFDSFEAFEAAVRGSLISKIKQVNQITEGGNVASADRFDSESTIYAWPAPPEAPPIPAVQTEGAQMDCSITNGIQQVDEFTKVRVWTRNCEEYDESETTSPTGGVTTTRNSLYNYTDVVKRYYESGNEIEESAIVDEFLKTVDLEKVYEAITWIDKNVEEKNREVFEVAMGEVDEFQRFFFDTESDGYEVVEILGEGTHENGLELAFSPLQIKADREYEDGTDTGTGIDDDDLTSLCEGIPSRPELDMEYLKAKEKFVKFQFKNGETKNVFLGQDMAKTFLNTEAEDKCDQIPSTLLYWPSKIACSAKATASGASKKLFLGENLGTTKPFEPVIESFDVDLKNKNLLVESDNIMLHAQSVDPLEVKVKLVDIDGKLQEQDFSTQVELDFSTQDAARLFKIAPSQSLPLTKGEAIFYLIPQTSQFGGKIEMTATATRDDSELELASEPVPVLVSRYGLFGISESEQVVVKDKDGVKIKARILDQNNKLTSDMDGVSLKFKTEAGSFIGGENRAIVKEGIAEITLLPGTKAGKFKIYISDPSERVAPYEVNIELLPDDPATIYVSKKSSFLVQASSSIPITAKLLDQYGNIVYDVFHKWSWQWENLNIESLEERDIDPRVSGLQEFTNYSGESTVLVSPTPGTSTARLTIGSDYWEDGNARSLGLTVIKDPTFWVELNKSEVIAGGEDTLSVSVEARTAEGTAIKDDFNISLVVSPVKDGAYPETIDLVDGRASFDITPGTLAGKFKLFFHSPGFVPGESEFTVLPGEPEKIELSRSGNVRYAAEFDTDKTVPIEVKVLDEFRNVVPTFTDRIDLRATEVTSYLVDIPDDEKQVTRGSNIVELQPKGLAGKVRLIAEHDDLVGDTLEFDLADFFRIQDVKNLAPKSLLTLILGFEAGDLRDKENFANTFLHVGSTQSVGTLTVPPLPPLQYGSLAPAGRIGNGLIAKFVSSSYPEFLLESDDKILTQQRLFFGRSPKFYLNQSISDEGVYVQVEDEDTPILLTDKTLYWKEKPLLRLEPEGGLTILSGVLELVPTDNIFVWDIEYESDVIGTLTFEEEAKELQTVDKFELIDDFSGLQIRPIDTDIYFNRVFVGKNTHDALGVGIFDQQKTETRTRRLGADFPSAESLLVNNELVWDQEWKPGTTMAAFNSIGISSQWGSSDAFIMYGDPSLKLRGENERKPNGFTQDIGRPLWRSGDGTIRKIIGMDVNDDGNMDVLSLVENTLYALYQTDEKRAHFRDTGPIIKFTDGVVSLAGINLGNTENPDHKDLIQLNSSGKLKLWKNKDQGVFRSHQIDLGLENSIESFQVAKLNTDNFEDLIVVDRHHKVWALYGKANEFHPPVFIKDLSPEFRAIDESFAYAKDDYAPINLKYSMFSFEGIREVESIEPLEWNRFTRPTAPVQTEIEPEDLEPLLLNDYYNTGGETLTDEAIFVRTDQASFLSEVTLETTSDNEKLKPGDRIKAELVVTAKGPLKNFALLPAKEGNSKFLEETFRCSGCSGDVRLYPGAGDGFFWAEVGDISDKVTFTWQEEISELNTLKFFVGNFDKGFDDLDDVTLPWFQEDTEVLMQFLTQKKTGDKASTTESPYLLNPDILTVSKPKLSLDLIQNLSEEDLNKRSEELFGRESDIDNDNLPYSFDHYNSQNNFDVDRRAALGGGNVNFDNLLKSNNQEKRAQMLMGGGSCFNQPESAAPNAPGLINDRKVPHAKPKGKQQGQFQLSWLTTKYTPSGPVPSTSPPDSPGERTEPHPYKSMGRYYVMPTSTGKTGTAICTGSFPVHMAAPNWAPNCFVSTPPVKFMQSCANPQDYEPKEDQLMCAADSFVSGSSAIATSGGSAGKGNASMGRGPGKINAPLTGTNATSFQNLSSGMMNNDKTGKGNATASSMKPNPDFSSKTRTNPMTAGGKKDQNLNNLMADIVNVTHEPVPVSIPATSQSEMDQAEEDFAQNQEQLKQVMDEKIPPAVVDLKDDLEVTLEDLEMIQKGDFDDFTLPPIDRLTLALESYESQLEAFRGSIEEKVCTSSGKASTCENGRKLIRQAEARLRTIKTVLGTDYQSNAESVETFVDGAGELSEEIEIFSTDLESYVDSLESPIEAREELQNHMVRFEQNFKNLDQAAGSGAQKVLQIRDLENKIVSSTAQIVEQYQNYHKGWMAQNQKRENEWKAQSEVNKQILSMMQTVPQIYTDFANNCRTGTVDRATLLPWLTDHVFEKGASRKVINLPTTPNTELDGRQMTPAKMDLKLPTPQITQVAIGPLDTMENIPEVPDYSEEIDDGVVTFTDKVNLAEKVNTTRTELENWNEIYNTLRKTSQFFPTLDSNGNITQKGSTEAILPAVSTNFDPVSLDDLENLLQTEIPELIEEKRMELPFVKNLPATAGGGESSFQPDIPSLPMSQLPFLPPPPKMDNLTCGMLNNLKVPLSFLNLECMIRLGVAPVSEWYVKPHVERRTNRSALSKNKDFTSSSIKPGPFTGNPSTMSVFGKSGRNSIFEGNHDQLKEAAKGQSSFIKSNSQSPSTKGLNSIPASGGETIKTSSLDPLKEWKNWLVTGETESEKALEPIAFLKALKHLSETMPTYVDAQEKLKVQLATTEIPESITRAREIKEIDTAFNNYLAKLESYRQERLQETKRLKYVYESQPETFFEDRFVQNTISKDKRFLAANTDSALDFEIPVREFTTSVAQFEPPVEDTADFEFVADNFEENINQDESSNSCANMVKPGIYYGDGNGDSLDRINKLPYRTISAYAVFDLDDDGVNEILYGLGAELFVKRKSGPSGETLKFNLEVINSIDLDDFERPVDTLENYEFYGALNSEFGKDESLANYTEWEFSERPDQIFELHKTSANKYANWKSSLGTISRGIPEQGTLRDTTAQIVEVKGSPQIKSPLKIPLLKFEPEACANENIVKPFIQSGMVMAIDEPATVQVYFPPNRAREARVEVHDIAPGEELYLEDADVCLFEGTAWFAQYDYLDEYDFWVTNQQVFAGNNEELEPKVIKFADGSEVLIEGRDEWLEKVEDGTFQNWTPLINTTLLSASQLRLKPDEEVTIVFNNGERRVLTGPMDYYFQINDTDEVSSEFRFPVPSFDQIYSQVAGFEVNQKSYYKPQFFPIITQSEDEE